VISTPLVLLSPGQQRAAANGLLLTASERLSREYTSAYHTHMITHSPNNAWPAPNVTSLASLARQRYDEARSAATVTATLLSPHQQHLLFRDCAPADAAHLVSLFETAWEQLHAYRLNPEDSAFTATENGECFRVWSTQVNKSLALHNWITPAQLLDVPAVWDGFCESFHADATLHRVGFDVLTAQQQDWFARMEREGVKALVDEPAPPTNPAPVTTVAFQNDEQELTHAISWACGLLAHTPGSGRPPRIGIVVPTLNQKYATVRRLLRTKLDPERHRAQGLFNIGGGIALSDQPAVASALQLLAAINEPQPHADIAQLLKNPYFPALITHKTLPPQAGTQLRLIDLPQDLRSAELRELIERVNRWPKEQPLAGWWREAQTILMHTQWHKARNDSAGFQAVERFLEVMRIQEVSGPPANPAPSKRWSSALAELNSITSRSLFAEATRDAPIQVLGYLEALELQFDHLWVVGMSDNSWPAQLNLNPFLPPDILRSAFIPRSNHTDELAFAQRWLNKVTHNAPSVFVSYVADDDDVDTTTLAKNADGEPILPGLTPLLTHTSYRSAPLSPNTHYHPYLETDTYPHAATEIWQDDHGTPPPTGPLRGGTSRFEQQAQCPFRAWAIHSLGLGDEIPPHSLPSAMEQGNLIHRALDGLFEQLPSHSALVEIQTDTLVNMSLDATKTAAGRTLGRYPNAVRQAEIERAQRLILNFLSFEMARPEFSVVAREQKTEVAVGDFEITVQLDRVDQTEQGRVVLDYKTGFLNTRGLSDDRLTAPQLPLYVLAERLSDTQTEVGGAFYALLPLNDKSKERQLPYKGVGDDDPLGNPRAVLTRDSDWREQCKQWSDQLTELAQEIASGLASVTPQKNACDFCHLDRLCRIRLTSD